MAGCYGKIARGGIRIALKTAAKSATISFHAAGREGLHHPKCLVGGPSAPEVSMLLEILTVS